MRGVIAACCDPCRYECECWFGGALYLLAGLMTRLVSRSQVVDFAHDLEHEGALLCSADGGLRCCAQESLPWDGKPAVLQQVQQAKVLAALGDGDVPLGYCLSRVHLSPLRQRGTCAPPPDPTSPPRHGGPLSGASASSAATWDAARAAETVVAASASNGGGTSMAHRGSGASLAGGTLNESATAAATAQRMKQGDSKAVLLASKGSGAGGPCGKENIGEAPLANRAPRRKGVWWRLTSGW